MDNFIFSINVTIPIFLVILIGYILRKANFLTEEFVSVANRYVFVVALPVMLFRDIAGMSIRHNINIKFFLYCMIVTVIMFFLVWGVAAVTIKDKSMIGAFAQAGARGSAAVLGVAFVENICGSIGMAPVMIVAAVPFFNVLSVIILVFNDNTGAQKDLKKIRSCMLNIAKNPIIIGILAGLLASLLRVDFPAVIDRTAGYISQTATPVALLAIGGGFDTRAAAKKIKPALAASFIKLIGLPAIFLPFAYALKFGPSEMTSILIMLASPTTVSAYVMAKNMNNDEILTSNVVVLTTLLSSLTLTGWIYVLRTIGCI